MEDNKNTDQTSASGHLENADNSRQDRGPQDDPRSENISGNNEVKRPSNRGFAALDPEKQKLIARQGGQAAHQQGVAHQWTSEEAREAGRKGGQNSGSRRNNNGAPNNP
ncbi:MAG TPA: KGG domain-containing protein [Chitinophagaceae bacterium]|nr:KGG domain-containing protein [Chitinophagaceae bacterium]